MVAATNLQAGSTAKTLGKNTLLDGEGEFYKIRNITSGDVVDGEHIIALSNSDTLIAELIPNATIESIQQDINELNNITTAIPEFIANNNDYLIRVGTKSGGNHYLQFSTDGIRWHKIADIPNDAFLGRTTSYDVDCEIINGELYLFYDYVDETYNDWDSLNQNFFLFGNRIGVTHTSDFVNYDKHAINIPTQFKQTANPRLLNLGGQQHLVLTTGDGTTTNTANTGYKHFVHLFNIDNTYENATNPLLLISSSNSYIDGCIYYDNSQYYLFVRNEETNNIEQYKAGAINQAFTTKINDIDYRWNLDNRVVIEGMSIVNFNGLYFMLCDSVDHRNVVFVTNNIENWYNCNWCDTDIVMGNAKVTKIGDTASRSLLNKFYQLNGYPDVNKFPMMPSLTDYINYTNKTLGKFYVIEDRTYICYYPGSTGYTITLDKTLMNRNGKFVIINETGSNTGLLVNGAGTNFNAQLVAGANAEFTRFGMISQGHNTIVRYFKVNSGALTENVASTFTINVPGMIVSNKLNILLTPKFIHTNARRIDVYVDSVADGTITCGILSSVTIDNVEVYARVEW